MLSQYTCTLMSYTMYNSHDVSDSNRDVTQRHPYVTMTSLTIAVNVVTMTSLTIAVNDVVTHEADVSKQLMVVNLAVG